MYRIHIHTSLLLLLLASPAAAHELSPLSDKEWDRAKAAHLLRRAGFGGAPAEVEELFGLGMQAAVEKLVDYAGTPFELAPPALAPEIREGIDRRLVRMLDEDERRKARQQRNRLEREGFLELRTWWLERMATTPRPFEEKMTLFWHGHFTSGFREVDRTWFLYEQNEFLRRYALANFRELLLGITRDRAMLVYLDNARNSARNPNENYARELLELFSLGLGNYSESDIRAAARALTGWAYNDDGFLFRERDHDYGPKTFLGRTGNWNGDDVIAIILDHPASSRYLARSLLEFFVTPDPPKPLVERFAAVIRRNQFNLKESMRALFVSEGFYDPRYRGSLVKSPVELMVSAARLLDVPLRDLVNTTRAMSAMGQELFQPPNVKGWDGGEKWINTATLYQRYNAMRPLVMGFGADRRGGARRMMRNDEDVVESERMRGASRLTLRAQPAFDPEPWVETFELSSAEALVGFLSRHLLAVPLPSEKRDLLIEYLRPEGEEFDPRVRRNNGRTRTAVLLICSTPEFQLF